ncbi:ABC transporter ATP-binding protein [Hydrogenoanaerobacterium sp.]|uniref:ABC transporter ATP-binding protein n=1 Tax=Hydrogenoanaerobacterium sp. TaxID=2953763 RepID=UPI00289C352E|nr:ABC transporter ATP-binding protein [Hydrogenoanaerobacterium sp.]
MRTVFKELKSFKIAVLGVVILTFCGVLADLQLPNLLSNIINKGIVTGDNPYIIRIGLMMIAFAVLSAICNLINGFLSSRISTGLGRNLRRKVFVKVESFSLHEFDQIGTASLITRTTNDITQVQTFMMMFMRIVLQAPVMAIGGIFMAVSKNAGLSAIIFASILVLVTVVVVVASKAMPLSKSMQKKLDTINRVLREKLTGIRVIRAFNTDEHEHKRFDAANIDLTATAMKMQRIMTAMMPAVMLIMNATTIAIVAIGAKWVGQGTLLDGDVVAVIQYVMQIMMSLTMLSMIFVMLPRASASADRINEVLNMELSIQNPEQPAQDSGKKGYVEFKDVSFSFDHAEEAALSHITFSAKPGETTAIIGSTGSGKTTLVNLIPRLYDATEGQVLVDGIDVREYDQTVLRDKIGYVPQKAVLFTGSIAENIRYGDENATSDDLKKAAEIAQAWDFISEKPHKLDEHIAQGGTNVSGGQKQRLAIARAIAKRPEIYIFDDSFSALDFKTDAQLRKSLKPETKEATVIIVAQRVSTIMDADRILVLDEGSIAGEGTHRELLKTCDVYKEIVSSQLSAEEIEKGGNA